jgi:hypothetical protein
MDMSQIKVTRPKLPPGYADNPQSILEWEQVAERLSSSKNYWLASTRPDGRPHTVPRWGVFIENKFYYDGSPETVHARNILENPQVSLHLESGDEAVIANGISCAAPKPEPSFARVLASNFAAKYEKFGYTPSVDQWDQGGLFVFTPSVVLAWTVFFENPTKFIFK